jgi:alanine dehydrogenase
LSVDQKKITALAFEYIKDEGGTYPAVKSLSKLRELRPSSLQLSVITNEFGKDFYL